MRPIDHFASRGHESVSVLTISGQEVLFQPLMDFFKPPMEETPGIKLLVVEMLFQELEQPLLTYLITMHYLLGAATTI